MCSSIIPGGDDLQLVFARPSGKLEIEPVVVENSIVESPADLHLDLHDFVRCDAKDSSATSTSPEDSEGNSCRGIDAATCSRCINLVANHASRRWECT